MGVKVKTRLNRYINIFRRIAYKEVAMKKLFFIVLVCALALAPAFAADTMKGTIRFLTMAEYHNALEGVIKAFEASHPGVTIETEEFPFAQLFDAIEIKLGSRNSKFDVILTDATMVSGYAYRGFIAPLDEYFTTAEKSKFTPALVNSGSFQGEFYAPPLKNSCHVLWYNKKLLDKAGIPYPSADPKNRMTWEEVVDISKKVMAASGDSTIYGLTFEQISRPYQILPLINSLGGVGIGPDGITVDGYVNGEGFVKAMQWYSDIHNTLKIAPKGIAPSETVGQFTAGKIAFLSANLFDYKTFEKTTGLQYGYAPLPYFKDGKPVTPTDSFHVSVSNYSKNKALAAEFVKYLTFGEGSDIYLEKQGEFSARIDVLNSYSTDLKYNSFPFSAFRLAAQEAKTTAFPRPLSLGYREWESVITATMEDIRNGADVKPALDKAVKTLTTQLSIYR
jgi:ABC-type glycerol-3-phosphate transport system substrate-binding protein